jgi:hypothetical protein
LKQIYAKFMYFPAEKKTIQYDGKYKLICKRV